MLCTSKPEFKNVVPEGAPILKTILLCNVFSVSCSKTGFRGRCGNIISKSGLNCKLQHPSKTFNKRIMNIGLRSLRSVWEEDESNAAQPHPLDQRGQELQVRKYVPVGGNNWYIQALASFLVLPLSMFVVGIYYVYRSFVPSPRSEGICPPRFNV